ncbi:MAG: hypothetical protein KBS81_10830 [Spirochaetales bacterium]|nr:hypothetical protein [Candidatus Physcosoma equi]
MKKFLFALVVLFVLSVLTSCVSSSYGYVQPSVVELNGAAPSTSSQTIVSKPSSGKTTLEATAEEILQESLAAKCYERIVNLDGKTPRLEIFCVAAGDVPESAARTLFNKVKGGYVNSRDYMVLAGSSDKEVIRSQRLDQQTWANPDEMKILYNESAADISIVMSIFVMESTSSQNRYMVVAQAIDVETGSILYFFENDNVYGPKGK